MPPVNCLACGVRITFLADSAGQDRRCACGCLVTVSAAAPNPEPPVLEPELRFRCPLCRKRYRATAGQAGRRMECKRCAAVLLVPDGTADGPQLTPTTVEAEADTAPDPSDEHQHPEPDSELVRVPRTPYGDDGLGLMLLRRRRKRKRGQLVRWAVLGGVATLSLLLTGWAVATVTRHRAAERAAKSPTKSETRDGRAGKSPTQVEASSRGQSPPQQSAAIVPSAPDTDFGGFITLFVLFLATGFMFLGIVLVRQSKGCSWAEATWEVGVTAVTVLGILFVVAVVMGGSGRGGGQSGSLTTCWRCGTVYDRSRAFRCPCCGS